MNSDYKAATLADDAESFPWSSTRAEMVQGLIVSDEDLTMELQFGRPQTNDEWVTVETLAITADEPKGYRWYVTARRARIRLFNESGSLATYDFEANQC